MARKPNIDFASATAEQIAEAILTGVTNRQNLHSWRTRNAGNATKADRLYPHTRQALQIVEQEMYKRRKASQVKDILRPFNRALSEGADILELMKPVLDDWRLFLTEEHGVGLMPEQCAVMALLQSGDYLKQIKDKRQAV
ncbi:hypothetical protein QFX71_001784 [Citrobacter amalonaticus]|nr:hypothetical protein [Citrobacter amalonaticus]